MCIYENNNTPVLQNALLNNYTFTRVSSIYSWLSLSRPRLSRITAYLEAKIWSLPKDENLTTGNKILWKRGEIAPNFSSFPQYLQYTSNYKSLITYTFVKCGCSIYFFLNSAILICRGTDISKYFRESLGIRDNESQLYIWQLHLYWSPIYLNNRDAYELHLPWVITLYHQRCMTQQIKIFPLRKHAYSNTLKILPPKNGIFFT